MVASDPVTTSMVPAMSMDEESLFWVRGLTSTAPDRDAAVIRLHGLLLEVCAAEVRRRGARFRLFGPEMDDLAHQAAADATMAVCRRIDSFRGESRFTTWAYKFAIFEVAAKLGRHFWRDASSQQPDWEALPDKFGAGPGASAESMELLNALQRSIERVLTDRQRNIFIALALKGIPLDAVVAEYGSNRNAIYKTMSDARRKLRSHLVSDGFLDERRETTTREREVSPRSDDESMGDRPELERFLHTDPRDVGCGRAIHVLHVYAELIAAGTSAQERYPGVAAHLAACGPCGEDFEALLRVIGGP